MKQTQYFGRTLPPFIRAIFIAYTRGGPRGTYVRPTQAFVYGTAIEISKFILSSLGFGSCLT